jgi:16S rRNA (adenine1518-N6/adenine1519-N6)-dimethyltransferase
MASSIPALLRAHNIRPRKELGQNFLSDPAILDRIVSAAELTPQDRVVEIGAGLGSLTRPLATRAGHVVAVELDERLIELLHHQVADLPNVDIVHANVLDMVDLHLAHMGYKVVGNLPYSITSAVLRHFLEKEPRPSLMVVTVQREVAQRIVAGPGDMSLLALSVQLYGLPRIVARIKAGAFYPPPKVDSAVVRIDVSPEPTIPLPQGIDDRALFRTARAGFGQKRKTLRNSLSAGLAITPTAVEEALQRAAVNPGRRPETLSLEEWARVTEELVT